MPSVSVGSSPVEGRGVFATEPVHRGDTVLVLDTSRLVNEEHPLRPEEDEQEDHLAYLAGGKVVLLPEPERHLNHSCDPNAYLHTVEDDVRLVARRPIQAGEEVTIDYLINTHGGSSWRCRCGADRCRGLELPLLGGHGVACDSVASPCRGLSVHRQGEVSVAPGDHPSPPLRRPD